MILHWGRVILEDSGGLRRQWRTSKRINFRAERTALSLHSNLIRNLSSNAPIAGRVYERVSIPFGVDGGGEKRETHFAKQLSILLFSVLGFPRLIQDLCGNYSSEPISHGWFESLIGSAYRRYNASSSRVPLCSCKRSVHAQLNREIVFVFSYRSYLSSCYYPPLITVRIIVTFSRIWLHRLVRNSNTRNLLLIARSRRVTIPLHFPCNISV